MYWFASSSDLLYKSNNIRHLAGDFEPSEAGNGMPDYVYLLENRLSGDQQNALRHLREVAREAEMVLFLTGDAVRDLTSGHAVRDFEVSVHGNALKLKKKLESLDATVWGEDEVSQSLYLCFPGTVRVDVVSTHRVEYPKPGKPVFHSASIHEDLRRRDFTVNSMAISLNEGSFGLLMDPLNGAADIETRTLRLVSNYGFLEEPSLLIRAVRYMARLGWELDPRSRVRYDNAKAEGVIDYLSAQARSRELEQIGHEEEGLKVMRALEAEGWMKVLFPPWSSASADEEKLKALHELAVELLLLGVHADTSAAQMRLLTAKLASKDLTALKKLMLRPGFVDEWSSLDAQAASFHKALLAKENATPSVSYKLFTSYDPEAVLWLGFTSKEAAVQERYHLFLKVWPEARQRIPYALMQEMRITHDLPVYRDLVQALFLELIDGRLTTPEELRAFLEPHSPPAPPPQVTIKRPRGKRGEARAKEQAFDEEEEEEEGEDAIASDEDLDDIGADEDEIDLGISIPKSDLEPEMVEEAEGESEELEDEFETPEPEFEPEPEPEPDAASVPVAVDFRAVSGAKSAKKTEPAIPDSVRAKAAKPAPRPPAKAEPVPLPAQGKAKLVPAAKKATVVTAKVAKPAGPAKGPAKTAAKSPAAAAKIPAKAAPNKGKPAPAKTSKPPEKKPAAKPARKR